MYVATAEEMRRADQLAIQKYRIPSLTLMENAGKGAFELLRKRFPDLARKKVVVIAGKGNNGGDGRLLARHLKGVAKEVQVISVGAVREPPLHKFDIIIDAIFGTGLSRQVTGPIKEIIEEINRSKKFVFSLDIPSGLSANSGRPLGISIRANLTVTMGLPKLGLLLPEADPFVGELEVIDIGIPPAVYEEIGLKVHWVAAQEIRPLFFPRPKGSHKGSYGHLLLIGGSTTKLGAILLAGRSALRTGSGRVTVALPAQAFKKSPLLPPFAKGGGGDFLELMYEPLPKGWKKLEKLFEGKSVIAVGPGMGVNADTRAFVFDLLKKNKSLPMVLDADALNCVASRPDVLKTGGKIVITPHPGEMARLTGTTTKTVQSKRIDIAREFAVQYQLYVVLKGYRTIIATPAGEIYINSTGNPGMATAGMGDVLTGVIGSLIGQGMEFEKGIIAGVFLHGRAGDRVAERLGDRGLLATDVIEEIPLALREIIEM